MIMNEPDACIIRVRYVAKNIATGIRGLDELMSGGFPEEKEPYWLLEAQALGRLFLRLISYTRESMNNMHAFSFKPSFVRAQNTRA